MALVNMRPLVQTSHRSLAKQVALGYAESAGKVHKTPLAKLEWTTASSWQFLAHHHYWANMPLPWTRTHFRLYNDPRFRFRLFFLQYF
jgi:hypothetical protein